MLDRSTEDVLSGVLAAYQVRAVVSANPQFCGEWRMPENPSPHAMFHLIDRGACLLYADGLREPIALSTGDLVVVPRGNAHLLRSHPGQGPDAFTTLLCGDIMFGSGKRHPVLEALPDFLVVKNERGSDQFRCVAELLSQESRDLKLGQQAVLDRLADTLFVMAVRHHLNESADHRGILAAIQDPRLAKALAAMHTQPERDWTVAGLADIAAMSRTAFAQRFNEVLGISPIHHLTEWRMTQAERLLQDQRLSVAAVAERMGYRTEAAFRRSFKRFHGFGPGHVRRAAAKGEQILASA